MSSGRWLLVILVRDSVIYFFAFVFRPYSSSTRLTVETESARRI